MGRLLRLVRKELSEILRDRRTIVTLVAMPLLLYPLMTVAFQQFFLASRVDPAGSVGFKLGFATKQEFAVFYEFLTYGERILRSQSKPDKAAPDKPDANDIGPKIDAFFSDDLAKLVQSGAIDLALRIQQPERFQQLAKRDVRLEAEAIFVAGNPTGHAALSYVERRLQAIHNWNLNSRLGAPGPFPVAYMRLARTTLEQEGTGAGISLAALVPLILILMTITGAVYPAIDLTAGERERGTLEILVAAPVPRLGLLFAKYVSVFTIAVLTALVNLTMMLLTLSISGLSQVLFREQPLTAVLILQLLGLMLLFAAFFSAVLLSLTSFAHSFKEAQAYLIPLMLASLGPGLIGMMPGIKLEGGLQVVPLLNIVLLARDLFDGQANLGAAALVVVSTLAYAAAAIALAARVFGAESVLYNEQSGWSDLFRRPERSSAFPSVSSALWCLVLMVPTYFFVSQGPTRLFGPFPLGTQIIFIAVLGVVLFAGFPLFAAYRGRIVLTSGFGLTRARLFAYLGGILLGLSIWPMLLRLMEGLEIGVALRERLAPLVEQLMQDRQIFFLGLFAATVMAALAEELFFRGYLFSALSQVASPWLVIPVSALLFGLMHAIMGGAAGSEQMFSATIMGLILGAVRWSTGSVVPAMLLHVTHNGLLVVLRQVGLAAEHSVPDLWVWLGAAGTIAGVGLLVLWGRRENSLPRAE